MHHFVRSSVLVFALSGAVFAQESDTVVAPQPMAPDRVAGLGYVEPDGGVTTVAGGPTIGSGVVFELRVGEGDTVSRGDTLAVLGDNPLLQAALLQAESRVAVQQAQLARVMAGVSQNELAAQNAVVDRLEKQLNNVIKDCLRQQSLFERKIISEAVYLKECNRVDAIEGQLNEAIATRAAVSTIRPEDVLIAEAELAAAKANVAHAKVALEGTLVRAPTDGTVLEIYAKPGELIGPRGLLDMGDVRRMWVAAEVYESDILKVKPGQRASVIADGIDRQIEGEVARIGLTVARNELQSNNPTADVDARVVEVMVLLDEGAGQQVAALINLQVSVIIHP
ncbi:HlyD family efflux transporter periplasmic adaptor subunit [Shimia abyssi]|uniref:HlyD family secretion protein n=1 Tax=Shimia abyssi TaxID=1662395 RepID=A0A2P8FFP7_9RHOB|nr:HlyD family efflux transporter periplasmic adaptor subunit [Shimia abyssi]PSL20537.1 HlyD family secretion protein [Shimia abyssi]